MRIFCSLSYLYVLLCLVLCVNLSKDTCIADYSSVEEEKGNDFKALIPINDESEVVANSKDIQSLKDIASDSIIRGNRYEYTLIERIQFSSIYPQIGYSSTSSTSLALSKFEHSFDLVLSSQVESDILSSVSEGIIVAADDSGTIASQLSELNQGETLSFWKPKQSSITVSDKYTLGKNFARGNFGEVWYARGRIKSGLRLAEETLFEDFVLKRIYCEKGRTLYESGKREIYMGKKLSGKSHITRFIESFSVDNELWLVFKNEGKSLDKILYEEVELENRVFYQPSHFWHTLRDINLGLSIRVEIMYQLLQALKVLENNEVAHRDLKPSNIFMTIDGSELRLKLGDFGSAFDFTFDLYESSVANHLQETERYSPPESRLFKESSFPYNKPPSKFSYDIWSAGVVYLELFLGTEEVFAIDDEHKRKKIEKDLLIRARKQGIEITNELRNQAEFIEALGEFGIHPYSMNKTKFAQQIRARDRFSTGMSQQEIHMLFNMLQWKGENRHPAMKLLTLPLFNSKM